MRAERFPWSRWFDGRRHVVKTNAENHNMAGAVYAAAKRMGVTVTTKRTTKGLVVQAVADRETRTPLERIQACFDGGEWHKLDYVTRRTKIPKEDVLALMTRANGFVERVGGWWDFNPILAEIEASQ